VCVCVCVCVYVTPGCFINVPKCPKTCIFYFGRSFYACKAMLAWILAMALSLSVTSQCSVKRDEQINLVFGMEASFNQPCTVF